MGTKIIDKLNDKITKGEPFFSFEYFPPKTDEGVANLKERQMRMVALGPTFCDITWGAGGSTADVTLDVARSMQQEVRCSVQAAHGLFVFSPACWDGRGGQGGRRVGLLGPRGARCIQRRARRRLHPTHHPTPLPTRLAVCCCLVVLSLKPGLCLQA